MQRGRELIWARGAATTGRPYLARAAEEHSGPHEPWFWQGRLQGGGVLNDMMCHSALVVRHLLTKPGERAESVRPVRVTGHIASLKWTRPEYAKALAARMPGVDYTKAPAEDFASVVIEFETADGHTVIGEATTSWSFVGAGLRLSAELLGPEYSMRWNSLDSGLDLFFSRAVRGEEGEDLVEKQNAEVGLMPVVADEQSGYLVSAAQLDRGYRLVELLNGTIDVTTEPDRGTTFTMAFPKASKPAAPAPKKVFHTDKSLPSTNVSPAL